MPHYFISHCGLALAMLPAVFGTNALLRPEAALFSAFNFPLTKEPQARDVTKSLVRVYGVRNISVSYLLVLIWSTGDDRLKARGLLAGLAICLGDGFISRQLIGRGEWNHWSFTPIISGICAALLGWFD